MIVNPIKVIDAIDSSSTIEHFSDEEKKSDPELNLRYKFIRNLILDSKKVPKDAHIFLFKYDLSSIYVSETLKQNIESVCPDHGGKFTEVELTRA